jgi:hypothetical protein
VNAKRPVVYLDLFCRFFPPFRSTYQECCARTSQLRDFIREFVEEHTIHLDRNNPKDLIGTAPYVLFPGSIVQVLYSARPPSGNKLSESVLKILYDV